jgi:hypothetical protein
MPRPIPLPSLSTLAFLLFLATTTTTTFNPSSYVNACGVTIHNEVAFRASRILLSAHEDNNNSTRFVTPALQTRSHAPSLSHAAIHANTNHSSTSTSLQDNYTPLLEQRDLLLAGSFFPDWGYNCIGKLYNEAAEEVITHTQHTCTFASKTAIPHSCEERMQRK